MQQLFGYMVEYLGALFAQWKWVLTIGPWFIENVFKRTWPSTWQNIDRFVPERVRQVGEVAIILLGVFAAGFFAWKAEREDNEALRKQVIELQAQLSDRAAQRKEIEDEGARKNAAAEAIAALIDEGDTISQTFESRNDKDLISSQYRDWETRCTGVIKAYFGAPRLAQFRSARGMGCFWMVIALKATACINCYRAN